MRVNSAIYKLSIVWLLLSFCISPSLLNYFVPYSQPGGSFMVKFHPASWVAAPLGALALFVRARRADWTFPAGWVGGLSIFGGLAAYFAVTGRGAVSSTAIDIYISPIVFAIAISRLSHEKIDQLARLFVAVAIVSAVIVCVEYVIRVPLVPRDGYETYFRPAGLFGHPIAAGSVFCCAMLVVAEGGFASALVRPLVAFLLIAIALCGVRGPLLVGAVIFASQLIWPLSPRHSLLDYAIDGCTVLSLPLLIVGAHSVGAFDRVLELGVWEESAQSRFYIFESFEMLSRHEIMHGVGSYGAGEALALQTTGGAYVENVFVSLVFQTGMVPASLWVLGIAALFGGHALRKPLYLLMVVVVAVASLGFGVKNMVPAALFLSALWAYSWSQSGRNRSLQACDSDVNPNHNWSSDLSVAGGSGGRC